MKKVMIMVALCLFMASGLWGIRLRAYTQKVTAVGSKLPFEQFPDVNCKSTQTAPGYVVNAWITTRPKEVISTLTHTPLQIRLYKFGNGTSFPYDTRVFFSFGNFTTDWTAGETVRVQIINNNLSPSQSGFYDFKIPDNKTSALTITKPQQFDLWKKGKPGKNSVPKGK